MLKRIDINGIEMSDTPLRFGTREQSIADVEVVLTNHLSEVAGVVTDDGGRPSSDATVVAFSADPTLWYAESRFLRYTNVSADGTFSLGALPPGQYGLAGIDNRDTSDVSGDLDNPDFLVSLASRAAHITVTDNQRTTVGLRLPR